MLLDARQVSRFYRLLDLFIAYAARRLNMAARLVRYDGSVNEDAILEVAEAVWGNGGERSLVEDFVRENPKRLGRGDLREIANWSEAICADFPIVRDGRDVLFFHGDHAFAVRGLSREVDELTGPLPGFARTVIIPFAEHITYVTCISALNVQVGPTMAANLAKEAAECRREGRLATTARQFAQLAPIAREEELQREAEDFAYRTEMEMNADELGAEQHAGALAGLSWDEREQAVLDHRRATVKPLSQEEIWALIDEECLPGSPTSTLEGTLSKLDRDELYGFARRLGATGISPTTGKRKLIQAMLAASSLNAEELIGIPMLRGVRILGDLRRVYDAGGRIDVPRASVTKLDDVPEPSFPVLALYREGDHYSAVIPRDAMEELAGVDWDAELARSEAFDQMARMLDLMVDFRGVVPMTEGLTECFEELGFQDDSVLLMALVRNRCATEQTCFDMVLLDDDDEVYLVHYVLAVPDERGRVDNTEARIIDMVLDEQYDKDPRPIAELVDDVDRVADWVFSRPSTRALVGWLDAHVPEGQDDYDFAEDALEDVIPLVQGPVSADTITFVLDALGDHGFVPTEAQLHRLLELLTDFVNDVPKWTNNGWAPSELGA